MRQVCGKKGHRGNGYRQAVDNVSGIPISRRSFPSGRPEREEEKEGQERRSEHKDQVRCGTSDRHNKHKSEDITSSSFSCGLRHEQVVVSSERHPSTKFDRFNWRKSWQVFFPPSSSSLAALFPMLELVLSVNATKGETDRKEERIRKTGKEQHDWCDGEKD